MTEDIALIAPAGTTPNRIYHLRDSDDPTDTLGGRCGNTQKGPWREVPLESVKKDRRLCKACDPDYDDTTPRKDQGRSLRRAIQAGEIEVPADD